MSPSASRLLAAAAAAALLTSAASADGAAESAIPANAVVRVADGAIKRSTFKHWFGIAARSATRGPGTVYRPPDFARCVRHKRKAQRATRAQLKTQCRLEYEGLRDQVLQFLILERWVRGEAAAQGVGLSAEELDKAFRKAKRDTFPTESDFRRFLKRSGITEADARFQVAFNSTYTELRRRAIAAAAPVTDAEVTAFYNEDPARFAEPETRDVRVVLTKTRRQANAARAALERGQTWRHVARKYSIDQSSRRSSGLIRQIPRGSQERALDDALFRAPRGTLRGPLKTQFGYYVFKVLKITPAEQPTLAEASRAIREELKVKHQREADDAFNEHLRSTWRPRTTCRAGYITSDCANGPLPPPPEEDDEYPDV